ncbi:Cpt-6 [Aphelenchoides besseyi]|nr:Cpt-6 [Aphelenchoides besseyi]
MVLTANELEKKRKKLPFKLHYHYPTKLEQVGQNVYNFTFDRLYPIKPWIFGSVATISTAYFYRNSTSIPEVLSSKCSNLTSNALLMGFGVATLPVILIRLFLRCFYFRYKRFLFEDPKSPSYATRLWQLCFYVLKRFAPPRLRSCDSLLPSLPVPDLNESVERYLQSMKPLMSEKEYQELNELAVQFLKSEGSQIQRKAWLYSWTVRNYVTPIWETYAYLYRRDPLIVNSSICCVDCMGTPSCNQPRRGAQMVYGTALNMLSFADRSQRPLADGLIFSGHYNRLYATARVPGRECDRLETIGERTRHFVCLSGGCFYRIELFDRNTNRLYSVEELTEILTDILKRDDLPTEAERKLCALTQDRRDGWAENRERFFLSNETNREFLRIMETAMIFLVFDEADDYGYEKGNYDQLSNFIGNMLTGNGMNRWTDKPINFIIGKNGRAGACSEHSVADGPEYFHITENKFFMDLFIGFPKDVVDVDSLQDYKLPTTLPAAKRMAVEIVEGMEIEIERCYSSATQLINDVDMASMVFDEWGKGRIKKVKCGPDGFFQMAIQLAYFKDQGRVTLTYEAASSRFYDFSRTETMRSVSEDSCNFVRAMVNGENRKECAKLLIKACDSHQYRTRLAMTGRGVDRHLFALYVISKGLKLESPFLEHYIQQPWTLSTTQIGYVTDLLDEDGGERNRDQCWLAGAFGATTKDGYGVAYRFMGNHSMVWHVTSYHSAENTNSKRLRALITESLQEMIALFD